MACFSPGDTAGSPRGCWRAPWTITQISSAAHLLAARIFDDWPFTVRSHWWRELPCWKLSPFPGTTHRAYVGGWKFSCLAKGIQVKSQVLSGSVSSRASRLTSWGGRCHCNAAPPLLLSHPAPLSALQGLFLRAFSSQPPARKLWLRIHFLVNWPVTPLTICTRKGPKCQENPEGSDWTED